MAESPGSTGGFLDLDSMSQSKNTEFDAIMLIAQQ